MSVIIQNFNIPKEGTYAVNIHVVKDGSAFLRWIDNRAYGLFRIEDVKRKTKAEWLTAEIMGENKRVGYWCSSCEEWQDYKSPYCPNCGARMEAGE